MACGGCYRGYTDFTDGQPRVSLRPKKTIDLAQHPQLASLTCNFIGRNYNNGFIRPSLLDDMDACLG